MTDDEWGEPESWDVLRTKERELLAPIEADYRAAIGPAKQMRDRDMADLGREYAEKTRAAKADYARAQKQFKETLWTLKRWKDATERAIENGFKNAKEPALRDRTRRKNPITEWYNRQVERLLKEQADSARGARE